uniref:Piwi like RNA-mediated silencing 3 n=1 Tax=Microcebus murinus TaxID=30608 RepID=A0A8B7H6G4_MICMU|nr:piwi-like protein 3 isoform X2 [Microcebus murinus]
MTGRARTRARGRARARETRRQVAPGAAAASPAQQPAGFRPRREEGPVVEPEPPRGAEAQPGPPEELQETAPKKVSLQQRTVFQDLVVNTRQGMEHVRCSKTGSEGTKVRLLANHFRVTSRAQRTAYQYNVNYQPGIEGRNLRTALLKHDKIGEYYIFDGNSLLLPHELREPITKFFNTVGNETVMVTITFSKELAPTSPDCLRFYNILFRRILESMKLEQIGRNFYNKREAVEFNSDPKLDIFPGYVTSILQYENSITLCADVSHKLMRQQTAYDLIQHTSGETQERIKKKVADELVGSIVVTTYNNKTYRVDGINWEQTPRDTFEKSDGKRITYIDYYKKQYNTIITDFDQPLLISQGKWKKGQKDTTREPIMLVPQLCMLTGLTDAARKNSRTMQALAALTRLKPGKRHHELEKFINTIQKDESVQKHLRRWDLNFDSNFLSFSGRTLTAVTKEDIVKTHSRHGQRAATSEVPLLTTMSLTHWLMLYSRENRRAASALQDKLQIILPQKGIKMQPAKMVQVNDAGSYLTMLRRETRERPQMVVCVLSNDKKDRYDDIKKYLCTECPTPSQCVVAKTLNRHKIVSTISDKLAQQMICKMGGALWKVDTGVKKTMFVGIDCFHDTVNRQKSIAGFVASTNDELTKWYSRCVIQEAGEEIVNGLTECVAAALKVWCKNEPSRPHSVIVYRDGVGDGQLSALLAQEIPQMLAGLNDNSCPDSLLTFIVVKKRINTRFFAVSQDSLDNPESGTVIDVELTRKEWYDFFIVSQSAPEGTVTPTHYNVIYDKVCLSPDTVQRLTYSLCRMYYNCEGFIRVPAPCHYAHKLAYLVGQSIHEQPSGLLSTFLYYL